MKRLFLLALLVPFTLLADAYQLPEGYEFVQQQVSDSDHFVPLLINGREVLEGEYPEVVNIRTGNSLCTATVVGPRTIITAAHCAETGAISRFTYRGEQFEAKITRSSLYPDPDHDIAMGYLNKTINVEPAMIAGVPAKGDQVTLIGYGCTNVGGGGGNDGVLRVGDSAVVGFQGYDFVARRSDGAALCFGDSGGPAFVFMSDAFSEVHQVMGVNSKGNIRDTSLLTRTHVDDSQDFFNSWSAVNNNAVICGVTENCLDQDPPTPPADCWDKIAEAFGKLIQALVGCGGEPNPSQD